MAQSFGVAWLNFLALRPIEDGPDDEVEKAEETRPPSSLNNIVGDVEISEEEEEQERHLARARKHPHMHRK